jgi:hypothetical protein
MANKTLLDAVNEILRRSGLVAGDAALLTSLTDSARQVSIDQAIQVINEGIDELYSLSPEPVPTGQKQGTITLIAGTRAYSMATDLSQLLWPMIDKTSLQLIYEFPGGYNSILTWDRGQNFTGLPHFAAISPVDDTIYLDRTPTSAEAGKVYTYQYDRNTAVSAAADLVPFGDPVFRAMVPAWVQLFKRERRDQFDKELFDASLGRAARLATQGQPRSTYSPR